MKIKNLKVNIDNMARKDIYNQEIEIQCYITRQSKRGAWFMCTMLGFFYLGV